MLPADIKSFKE